MQNYSVMHWSSVLQRGKEVINVARSVTPTLVRALKSIHKSTARFSFSDFDLSSCFNLFPETTWIVV